MELLIDIETNDAMFTINDLFESKKVIAGQTEKAITEGVSIRWEGGLIRKALGFPEIVRIALVIGEKIVLPVAVSLTAKWLYDKLKGKANKITIEYIIVEINEGEIKKAIMMKIQKKLEEK